MTAHGYTVNSENRLLTVINHHGETFVIPGRSIKHLLCRNEPNNITKVTVFFEGNPYSSVSITTTTGSDLLDELTQIL